jgi:hypothetical protein
MPGRRTNRGFVVAALWALLGVFVCDAVLYGQLGFLRLFGQATQEGQIVSKVARASRLAGIADVILFGSSYTRSGLSGQPFLDRGLLPWNFGISGGGPLTAYFALKRIAPVVAARPNKPVLILELKREALERRPDTLWSEYVQYLGIVRSRRERLAEAPLVWPHFREQGMTSQYVSSLVVPSGIYRSHIVQLFEHAGDLDGYFYGMEDFSGYAPLYTVAPATLFADTPPPALMSTNALLDGKMAALRRFLGLAHAVGAHVALYSSPTILLGRDATQYDAVVSDVTREFPDVTVLRSNEYPLDVHDFDAGGHPNIRGADKLSRFLIDRLQLSGSDLDAKVQAVFDAYRLPPMTDWTSNGDGAHSLRVTSPPVRVVPNRECVFEVRVALSRGRLRVRMSWLNLRNGQVEHSEVLAADTVAAFGAEGRIFLRAVPRAELVTLEILDSADAGGPPSVGHVEPLRFWSNRL